MPMMLGRILVIQHKGVRGAKSMKGGHGRPPAPFATSMQCVERHEDAGRGCGACLPDCSLKAGICRVPVMLHSALVIHHKGMRDARDMSCCHEHLPCPPVRVHDHLQQRWETA